MKFFIASMVFVSGLTSARADGWACANEADTLRVRVYNQVQPELGTRSAAVMVVSDPAVSHGRKTIARFTAGNTLSNKGSVYVAKVDLRYADSRAKGELIAGTKLGFVETIKLNVLFNYSQPVAEGELVDGYVVITKRDGEIIREKMACERYLKQ
jgi:hypothetical protein